MTNSSVHMRVFLASLSPLFKTSATAAGNREVVEGVLYVDASSVAGIAALIAETVFLGEE